MKISTIIRALLTVLLMVCVYKETGVFTTIALSLSALHAELIAYCLPKKNNQPLNTDKPVN